MKDFTSIMGKAMEVIRDKGAFLTVKDGEKVNTMTIGWANIGYQWRKPILTVLVRKSRYSYELIENTEEFTVSMPLNVDLKKELTICGIKSGRDIDKFKECNLILKEGKETTTPIIGNCDMHFECKIVYKQEMEPSLLCDKIKDGSYKNGDYHVLYYGEILDWYID
ncbi:flavin reductase family protein [Clostridium sp. MSJ-11]|uniref:Flavin reductase family protein n=1 Tax=Clostridium mobile TaxID=2841512 RepID=A0ABS6EKG1_9CLOT|nr:flavin reductase family protein [Clostridium mobile]MBU5484930.1 flavin reductase family protein [Clostridium mobile]